MRIAMRISNTDLSYITGFYEGEGTCGCNYTTKWNKLKTKKYSSLVLSLGIAQKDRTPLDWIRHTLNMGNVYYGKSSDCWYYNINCRKAEWLLHKMLPFMKSQYKIKQASDALKRYSNVVKLTNRLGPWNPNWKGDKVKPRTIYMRNYRNEKRLCGKQD